MAGPLLTPRSMIKVEVRWGFDEYEREIWAAAKSIIETEIGGSVSDEGFIRWVLRKRLAEISEPLRRLKKE